MIPPHQSRFGIDHPVISVRDHAVAVERFVRLGFAPSPLSYHPWGSVLTLMMFENNFIELIGVHDSAKFGTGEVNGFCYGRTLGAFLARSEGLGLVALHSKDIESDFAAVQSSGLPTQQRVDFRRKLTTPDGRPDEAVVSLGMILDEALGDASNFLCQQHRPEFIWVPAWQQHPNGATGVSEVVYQTPELALLETRWQKLFGQERVRRVNEHVEADTGCGRMVALTPSQVRSRFDGVDLPIAYTHKPHGIALQLQVTDLDKTVDVLSANGLPFARTRDGVALSAHFAGNTILEFVNASPR